MYIGSVLRIIWHEQGYIDIDWMLSNLDAREAAIPFYEKFGMRINSQSMAIYLQKGSAPGKC